MSISTSLCMIAGWYLGSLQEKERRGHPPEQYLSQLAGVFRRTMGQAQGTQKAS